MPGKLVPYDVVYCSSEDESHQVCHLVGNTYRSISFEDGTPGWQTSTGVEFPQVLILRFPGNVYIQQLRILSHESKIASKVEIRLYKLQNEELGLPPSFRSVNFSKLGYVQFSSNQESRYESKERKTIHLKVEAYFLKLLFYDPYENEHNRGNQVGVYAIECLGKQRNAVRQHSDDIFRSTGGLEVPLPDDDDDDTKKALSAPRRALVMQELDKPGKTPPHHDSGAFPPPTPTRRMPRMVFRSIPISQFDTFFIQRAEELIALNDAAAVLGDTAVVTACQANMNTLNSIADEMYTLEQEKLEAILEEDFGEAARIKDAMTEVMEVALRETELPGVGGGHGRQSSADYLLQPRPSSGSAWWMDERSPSAGSAGSSGPSAPFVAHPDEPAPLMDPPRSTSNPNSTLNPQQVQEITSPVQMDREITGKPSGSLRREDITTSEEKEVVSFMYQIAGKEEENCLVYPPEIGIDVQRLNSTVGPYLTACLASKRFKLREAAVVAVTERMADTYRTRAAEVEEAVLRFLDNTNFGLQDNIPSVVLASCIFIRLCLADEFKCVERLISPLSNLIPRLLTRAADSSQRIREEAIDTLERMIQQQAIPSSVFLSAILSGPVNKLRSKVQSTNPRPQMARLNFLQMLLQENRLSGNSTQIKLLYTSVLVLCMNHPSSDVREIAVGLTVSLIQKDLIKLYFSDLVKITNPALQDIVRAEAEKKGSLFALRKNSSDQKALGEGGEKTKKRGTENRKDAQGKLKNKKT